MPGPTAENWHLQIRKKTLIARRQGGVAGGGKREKRARKPMKLQMNKEGDKAIVRDDKKPSYGRLLHSPRESYSKFG